MTEERITSAAQAEAYRVPGEGAIWVFILGDMVMFSMFFGQFIYDRAHQIPLFTASQQQLSIRYGAINTIVLLTGSLFVYSSDQTPATRGPAASVVKAGKITIPARGILYSP